MNRTTIEDSVFPDCPIRNILSKLCDRYGIYCQSYATNGRYW